MHQRHSVIGSRVACGLLIALSCAVELSAQHFLWGGSLRYYQFLRLEALPGPLNETRRDTEFGSARFTLTSRFSPRLKLEAHAVFDALSPFGANAASLATGRSATYLPLEHDFHQDADLQFAGRFDRLNLRLDTPDFSIVAGRQAISWGVTYFWPVMDLFSSFAPQRIDREYKEGVDALRLTVPLGAYSEVQVIGAVLGPSFSRDGTAAVQTRIHLGRLDLGLMGGKFHGDTVGGAFFTTDIQGTAFRGEVTWTLSGDPLDQLRDRRQFWRASVGFDRQMTPEVSLTLELSYNGYGVGSASEYAQLALADRVQRGEVNALGTYYSGISGVWKPHPLLALTQTFLINWQDPSVLWIPALDWSTGDNSSFLVGFQSGFGGGPTRDLRLRSEYGAAQSTVFASIRWFF